MEFVEVRINEWIRDGFELYKRNFGLLVLASLIANLIGAVTLGLLIGPMVAGMTVITLALYDRRQPQPSAGEVFRGFNFFFNTLVFTLFWGVVIVVASIILNFVPIIGQVASLCFVYAVQALLMFSFFLMVDRGLDFWLASKVSLQKVQTSFWPFLGLGILSALIGSLGTLICGLGVIFTLPIQVCILTVAYREVFE